MKPLGLLVLCASLRRAGYQISFLDCLDRHQHLQTECSHLIRDRFYGTGHYPKEFLPKPACVSHIPRNFGRYGLSADRVRRRLNAMTSPPDIICVTSGMTYWYPGVFEMIALCRQVFKQTPVILGGVYAALCPEHARRFSGADVVFAGSSAESAVAEINRLTGFQPEAAPLPAICPDYSVYANLRTAAIRMTMGCPFRCPFCASFLLSGNFTQRNPDEVSQEITGLTENHANLADIAFYDDALLVNAESHFIPLLQRIIASGTRVRFHIPNGLHPRWIDSRTASLMFQARFKTIRLSYESISPERQQAMGGKVSNQNLEQAVRHLKTAGFTAHALGSYVLMGLPDQDLNEIAESVRFVFSLGIRVNLASFSPIPGTVYWKEAVASGLIEADADPLLMNNTIFPVVKDPETVQRLLRLKYWTAQGNQRVLQGESPSSSHRWDQEGRALISGR